MFQNVQLLRGIAAAMVVLFHAVPWLPFDPAAMGIAAWPEGTRFLHFQRLRNNGAYVFIAAPPVAAERR